MRCFVASFPTRASLRSILALRPPLTHLRWVPAERLHVTLQFLGERQLVDLAEIRKEIACLEARTIACQATGYLGLPDTRQARVVALRIESEGRLEALSKALGESLAMHPDRPFIAHLTLARSRRGVRLPDLPAFDPVPVSLDPPALYQSRPSTTQTAGPVYQRL